MLNPVVTDRAAPADHSHHQPPIVSVTAEVTQTHIHPFLPQGIPRIAVAAGVAGTVIVIAATGTNTGEAELRPETAKGMEAGSRVSVHSATAAAGVRRMLTTHRVGETKVTSEIEQGSEKGAVCRSSNEVSATRIHLGRDSFACD